MVKPEPDGGRHARAMQPASPRPPAIQPRRLQLAGPANVPGAGGGGGGCGGPRSDLSAALSQQDVRAEPWDIYIYIHASYARAECLSAARTPHLPGLGDRSGSLPAFFLQAG